MLDHQELREQNVQLARDIRKRIDLLLAGKSPGDGFWEDVSLYLNVRSILAGEAPVAALARAPGAKSAPMDVYESEEARVQTVQLLHLIRWAAKRDECDNEGDYAGEEGGFIMIDTTPIREDASPTFEATPVAQPPAAELVAPPAA